MLSRYIETSQAAKLNCCHLYLQQVITLANFVMSLANIFLMTCVAGMDAKTSLSLQNIIGPILVKKNGSAGKWHYAEPSNSTISNGNSNHS